MSDSVDRVFVHALATVRRLPRTGSSRPPPAARLRLYGLYKQSMEGDVLSILPRPTLPPSSPDPHSTTVHKYASRDLRAREAQAEIEKWDAWHACAGMSRTEAKRRYISTLIDTMKEYASGTQESRELVSELEFVWNQIRSQKGSSGSSGDENDTGGGDSPNRRLERAGLKQTYDSFARIPPGSGSGPGGGRDERADEQDDNRGVKPTDKISSRMRVLSPISGKASPRDADRDDENEHESPEIPSPLQKSLDSPEWRTRMEKHLHQLSTEIAALREQLSSKNLLSHSSYSSSHQLNLSFQRRLLMRVGRWVRWLVWAATRQVLVNLVLLILVVGWGRVRGDRRLEMWVRERWKRRGRLLNINPS